MKLGLRTSHERLSRVCFTDYRRELALVVELQKPGNDDCQILGIARLIRDSLSKDAEFALIVADPWQGQGLGTELLRRLVGVARQEQIARMFAFVMSENLEMKTLCRKLGFEICEGIEDGVAQVELRLVDRSKDGDRNRRNQ